MKIAFICTGLEPSKDGVGDYCYRLAEQCTMMGHTVILLAMNDRFVPASTDAVSLVSRQRNAISIKEARFSRDRPWSDKIAQATRILQSFRPDWISEQFVCYGWQRQGVIAAEMAHIRALSNAVPGSRTHMMMHELWVGDTREWPLYKRIIGFFQKWCIRQLLQDLKPATIHTSNHRYQERLMHIGIKSVELLPLFGNIPFSSQTADSWLYPKLEETGLPFLTPTTRDQFLLCGLFGSLPSHWPPEPLLSALIDAGKKMGKTPILLSAGRLGSEGAVLWNELKIRYAGRLTLLDLGELAPLKVSEYLSSLDIGVAAAILSQIGKSGATATMLDHGLPVVINRVDTPKFHPWSDRSRTLIHILDAEFADKLAQGLERLPQSSSVEEIAGRFLASCERPPV